MSNYYVILIAAVTGNLLVALYNTFNKEKVMIREGGSPLPTSSYVFLVLKYALWAGATAATDLLLFTQPESQWGLLFFTLGVVVSTYIIATILEVIIRVVIQYVYALKIKREVAKKVDSTRKDN